MSMIYCQYVCQKITRIKLSPDISIICLVVYRMSDKRLNPTDIVSKSSNARNKELKW